MSESVITLDENTSIIKALQVIKEHKIRRLPITRGGKLVGIVTERFKRGCPFEGQRYGTS
jgi:acetoin utilization protein AcuB